MNISDLYDHSYVPYSNKASVALVQSKQGAWFPGVRIENISYPLTINAVQNALFSCLSEGHQPVKICSKLKPSDDPSLMYWIKKIDLEWAEFKTTETKSLYEVKRKINGIEVDQTLQQLLKNPFVTYSNFPVSALIETEDGFITGINIETNDWSKGLCAERVALAKALSYGFTDFKALHISTLHGDYNSPCGACRQVLSEHLPHHPVYLHYADGTQAFHFSSDLLPYSFQASKLKQKKN